MGKMNNKASKIQELLNEYESGKIQESQFLEQLSNLSVIGPVLKVLNDLKTDKLIDDYVIGGGIAVLYYTEPVLTYDFDVFCIFPSSGVLIDPTPVFTYLKDKGYMFEKEDRINIEGVPVQFISPSKGLTEEAVTNSVEVTISGIGTKILSVEYLIAIMLQLNRPKDRAKIDLLANNDEVSINMPKLEGILKKYNLLKKWGNYSGR